MVEFNVQDVSAGLIWDSLGDLSTSVIYLLDRKRQLKEVTLSDLIDDEGADGLIYQLSGMPSLVIKLFKQANPEMRSTLKGCKMTIMDRELRIVALRNSLKEARQIFSQHFSIAAPVAPVYGKARLEVPKTINDVELAGYLMPFAKGSYWKHICNANVHIRAKTALALAMAVDFVNGKNIFIGDWNPKNFRVTEEGFVSLIDTDPYVITVDDQVYPQMFSTPQYAAPEVLGPGWKPEHYGAEQDRWSLALVIYELITGVHPFYTSGSPAKAGMLKVGQTQLNPDLRSGYLDADGIYRYSLSYENQLALHFAYRSESGQGPPAYATPESQTLPYTGLPSGLRKLARRCFTTGIDDPQQRPTPGEWVAALKQCGFTKCERGHLYYDGLPFCSECFH
jgi:DNA-binding helix-hairpin-helix protein with protein kinase domain